MSDRKPTTKTYSARALAEALDPNIYTEREPSYEFSNGRKFTKPQKNNRVS